MGCHLLLQGRNLPDPGIEPGSPSLEADALTSEPPGKRSQVFRDIEDKVLRDLAPGKGGVDPGPSSELQTLGPRLCPLLPWGWGASLAASLGYLYLVIPPYLGLPCFLCALPREGSSLDSYPLLGLLPPTPTPVAVPPLG